MKNIGFVGFEQDYVDKFIEEISVGTYDTSIIFESTESMVPVILEHIKTAFSVIVFKIENMTDIDSLDELRHVMSITNNGLVVVVVVGDQIDVELELINKGICNYLHYREPLEIQAKKVQGISLGAIKGTETKCLKFGEWVYNPLLRVFKHNKEEYRLTPIEDRILILLYENKGKVLTREEIYIRIKSFTKIDASKERFIDVHIANMRKKIKHDIIITVSRVGYCINESFYDVLIDDNKNERTQTEEK